MSGKQHWETVYATKPTTAVSWYQPQAACSLRLIAGTGVPPSAAILDVGGGASTLVDGLLAAGHGDVSVLDLSGAALAASRDRLGPAAQKVRWIEGDILHAALAPAGIAVWHDRAAFHFLTRAQDRAAYARLARQAVAPGGHLIIATFAQDGPAQCSGLPVCRYGPAQLAEEFADGFALVSSEVEVHPTPFGFVQPFLFCHFRRV